MFVQVALIELVVEPLVDEFVEICRGAYPVTRAYDGCQGINLTLNVENKNNFVMTEVWDTKEHYENYLAFRTEEGTVAAIQSMCQNDVSIRIFDITDA